MEIGIEHILIFPETTGPIYTKLDMEVPLGVSFQNCVNGVCRPSWMAIKVSDWSKTF